MIIEGNKDNFEKTISKGKILVDFYATWCGPCRMLGAELENIETVDILKIDIDKCMPLAKQYGIMNVPTMLYFKKDGTFDKKVGYMPKENILDWIDECENSRRGQ